jgi:hypothetical protein
VDDSAQAVGVNIITNAGCGWVVVTTGFPSWITASPPTSGSGPGTVTLNIAQYPFQTNCLPRTATLSIATVPFPVTQTCNLG